MSKFVSVPGSNGDRVIYHTNEDCKRIKDKTREVSDSYIEWHNSRLCEWCEQGTEASNP